MEAAGEGEQREDRGNGAATAGMFRRAWKDLSPSGRGGGSEQVAYFRGKFLRSSGRSFA
jgi:hypothetical protein